MLTNFTNFLTPQNIVNFLKNSIDMKRIAINFVNSEEAKEFIQNDMGIDYEDLKDKITVAFINAKKSNVGIEKQHKLEQSQKLQIYKELANSLIKDDGLSVYSAIILAAGFVGIEQTKVVDFLKSKGFTASKQKIEHYYKTNENFLKTLLKRKGKIISGWNDTIESNDLSLGEETDAKLVEIPDNNVEEETGLLE